MLALASLVTTIWSVVDIVQHDFKKDNDRAIWIIIAILLSPIGGVIYFFMRKQLHVEPKTDSFV